MEYYPHHIGDFLAATAHLSNDELCAYLRLIWMYYDKEEALPNEIPALAKRARSSTKIMKSVVGEFFTLEADGLLHHGRIDGELNKFLAKVAAARKAGKASARARRKERNGLPTESNGRSTDVQPPNTQYPLPNKKKDTTTSSPAGLTEAPGKVPIQAIVDAWNTQAAVHGMVKCLKITTTLRGQIRQRWADLNALKKWHNFFDHIGMNDFLAGRTPPGVGRSKPFRCSLLWATKETNFAKIAQGEYD